MEFIAQLEGCIEKHNSLLCIGLDSDFDRLPPQIKKQKEPLFEFSKAIADATYDLVCAYKPNSAFYEAHGAEGIAQLKKTCDYVKENYPEVPIILDAKRGDIGNTNEGYATFAFDYLGADAITVSPYLGGEALEAFLSRRSKGIIILCRTSNPGAGEFQDLETGGKKLYQIVAQKVHDNWNKNGNCLLVTGATYPEELAEIRQIVGNDMYFLVPGIGAQGGDIEKSVKAAVNKQGRGAIISTSREVIYAGSGTDFAQAARTKATEIRNEINKYRGVKK
jgi:orotidine-5'-phosphate decarboxylase